MERELLARTSVIAICSILLFGLITNTQGISGFFAQVLGPPPPFPVEQIVCGNDVCEIGEDSSNCCSDCGCPAGQICDTTSNVCYEEIEKFGIHLSDPEFIGPYSWNPSTIPVRNNIRINVEVAVEGTSKAHRVWAVISIPDKSTETLELQGSADGGVWETHWKVPSITGKYLAQFNAIDDKNHTAIPINASFYVGGYSQVGGGAVPISPPGY